MRLYSQFKYALSYVKLPPRPQPQWLVAKRLHALYQAYRLAAWFNGCKRKESHGKWQMKLSIPGPRSICIFSLRTPTSQTPSRSQWKSNKKNKLFSSARTIWAGKWSGQPTPQCIIFTFVRRTATTLKSFGVIRSFQTDLIPLFSTEWIILLCIFVPEKILEFMRHTGSIHFFLSRFEWAARHGSGESNNSLLNSKIHYKLRTTMQ